VRWFARGDKVKCTVKISGEEEEVLRAATLHAVDLHGHGDTPEFREQPRKSLKDELPGR